MNVLYIELPKNTESNDMIHLQLSITSSVLNKGIVTVILRFSEIHTKNSSISFASQNRN